jgi:hypothetical protein
MAKKAKKPAIKYEINDMGNPRDVAEVASLRVELNKFFDLPYDATEKPIRKIGNFKWGVYAFFDYDGHPIYVGQTNEKLRTRIGRHLTNQRTDAVAMSVLDPFEVHTIKVWPLPDLQDLKGKGPDVKAAKLTLDALEREITADVAQFGKLLNEKDPPKGSETIKPPKPFAHKLVSDDVFQSRSHPDIRIARRASTIAKLAQVISERKVQGGLRRVMMVQAERLHDLAKQRYEALGGAASVEEKATGAGDADISGSDVEAADE